MKGIKINTELTIGPETKAREIAEFLDQSVYSIETVEKVIRIYGKFQAKRVRNEVIEYLLVMLPTLSRI